ncbi:MAG: glycoside hydrolase family 3 N-terminal domain-containing protein, partial [Flavobacteriales bacterium]|nr:glycoside hydrolase family 3 N-terminal domain-containing protein [Flavobacteriales bacterium]
MKHFFTLLLIIAGISVFSKEKTPLYKNPKAPVEQRVQDLLSRMTPEEKMAQIRHLHNWDILTDKALDEAKLEKIANKLPWGFVEGFPLTGIQIKENMSKVQRYMLEKTRLGIPIFIVGESLHGSAHEGSTIFPQNIALGSTFNPELAYKRAMMTAQDLHFQGIKQVLAPCIDVVRDLRWGRVEECYGEDPFLCGTMGTAEVRGYLDSGILPMLKHFGPHGAPTSGLNLASVQCSQRDMRDVFLKPFEMVVKNTDIMAVMSTYNSWNRQPNSSSHLLLTDILRNEWGFRGFVYADWGAIGLLKTFHNTAENDAQCAVQTLSAGLDVEAASNCYPELLSLVSEGVFPQNMIDTAVARVLRVKFECGLFEDPYGKKYSSSKMHSAESVALAQEISQESVVLLKNEGNILPLDKNKIKTMAVIGPNADQVQFGDYSWSRSNEDGVSPLEGIKRAVGNCIDVRYANGCSLTSLDESDINEAVAVAKKSDVAVLFCGSASASLARDYSAATCGEGFDLNDLSLTGAQGKLIRAVYATGTPVVLVLVAGRPFTIEWEKEHLPAVLAQWYGGEREGAVIADVLFGAVNPSGRLTYTFPKSVGHLPMTYDYLPSDRGFYHQHGSYQKPGRDYVFSAPEPLWSFGYGLSYTSFEYQNVKINKGVFSKNDTICVSVDVKNTGKMDGKDVVQLYVRDLVSSVVMPLHSLRDFKKVNVKAGDVEKIVLSVPTSELYITDDAGRRVV